MELKNLIGKEVIHKGNTHPVLAVDVVKTGANVLKLKGVETDTQKAEFWVDIDEVRISVYYTQRPRLFGTMVDCYDGYAKVEWKDADGLLVPFRKDPKNVGQLLLDKEHRPMMTMKIFDSLLSEISLF